MSEIDVSKCEYYNFGECNRYDFPLSCTKCSNCYYQQLQQLKIKNEKLRFPREDIDFAVLTKEEFENYNKLKADNAKLREEVEYLKEEIDSLKYYQDTI